MSGYRSYERQEELYRKKLREQPQGSETPVQWVAPPGASEHQTGLALDVSCQAVDYKLDERFGETRERPVAETVCAIIWLYPALFERKEAYYRVWEPWHIRYVTRSLALYLTLTGLTLEEYYEQVISREVFWHVFAKIPRHTRQNAITEGDLECILTRNCEGTEQLRAEIK